MQERIKNCVLQIIEESVGTRGEGAYFIDLKVKGPERARKIEVLIDADDGIRIHQCAYISRRVRERLESDEQLLDMVGENFDLIVGSPGLGEPIIIPRQYKRHVGKLLSVIYTDLQGGQVELSGHLQEVSLSEESRPYLVISLEKGKKKGSQPKPEAVTLYLDQLIRAVPEAEL